MVNFLNEEKDRGYRIPVETGNNRSRDKPAPYKSIVRSGPCTVILLRTGKKNSHAEISRENSRSFGACISIGKEKGPCKQAKKEMMQGLVNDNILIIDLFTFKVKKTR